MDDFDYDEFPIITIPVGTVLYSGGAITAGKNCFNPFYYVGQRGKRNDGRMMYVGMSEEESLGYSIRDKNGILRVFKVKRPIRLRDVSETMDFYEFEDAMKFCKNADGYYINWAYGTAHEPKVEIFLCDAPKHLEYVKCKKGRGQYSHECYPLCPDVRKVRSDNNTLFNCIRKSNLNPRDVLSSEYYSRYKRWMR